MIAKMPLENFLIIDIETVSAQKDFGALQEDWKKLWEEKISLEKTLSFSSKNSYSTINHLIATNKLE